MTPSRLEKLQAHASRLLDLFIEAKEKHALLSPMLNDDVRQLFGKGGRARGFGMLQNTLGMACVLDLAKLAADTDERTPSIKRLVAALEDEPLCSQLRETFAVLSLVPKSGYSRDVLRILEESERKDEHLRRHRFDELVRDLRERWDRTERSPTLAAFLALRDKYLAHNELHHDGDQYKPLDVSGLGLKWSDIAALVAEFDAQVDAINLIYRGASFAFDMLEEQVTRAAKDFWVSPA
ncbi:MAG: hypothetical protein IIB35_06390 [Gemmatimonadetes bacterium]|nr:hypothetical protein [Gemmatimonadota bacterium]